MLKFNPQKIQSCEWHSKLSIYGEKCPSSHSIQSFIRLLRLIEINLTLFVTAVNYELSIVIVRYQGALSASFFSLRSFSFSCPHTQNSPIHDFVIWRAISFTRETQKTEIIYLQKRKRKNNNSQVMPRLMMHSCRSSFITHKIIHDFSSAQNFSELWGKNYQMNEIFSMQKWKAQFAPFWTDFILRVIL